MKISDLLNSPDRICKGEWATDEVGRPTNSFNPRASRWSLDCAFWRCYMGTTELGEAYQRLGNAIERRSGHRSLIVFGDHPETTFKILHEVLAEAGV